MTTTQTSFRGTNFQNNHGATSVTSKPHPTSYQRTGLLGKLETAVSSITNTTINIGKKAGTQLDYFVHSNITKESQQRWWSFGINDTLIGEFPCKCISGNKVVKGYLLLSYDYACFASSTVGTPLDAPIRAVIPLTSVVELRPCEVISTGQGITPSFRESNAANASSSISTKKAIQIFTNDRMIHQFFGFKLQFTTIFQTIQRSLQLSRQRATRSVPTYQQPQQPSQVYTQQPQVYSQPQTQNAPVQTTYPLASYQSNSVNTRAQTVADPAIRTGVPTVQTNTNSGLYPVLNRPDTVVQQQKPEVPTRSAYPQQESVRSLAFAELKAMQAV